MMNLLNNRVTFLEINDFYEPNYIIGKGSSAKVIYKNIY